MEAPSRRRSLLDGSISAGMNVGATVISMRQGTFGGLSVAPSAWQSGKSKRRVWVTWSIFGWLSGPIPTGPIRTVTLPVVREAGSGHQPSFVRRTTASPGSSFETSYLVYEARATGSSADPIIQPSVSRPTRAS